MKAYVLDANAVIIHLEGRNGMERVQKLLDSAADRRLQLFMSSVNLGEVFYSLWRCHGEQAARQSIQFILASPIEVLDIGLSRALYAGELKAKYHCGFADAFVAAIAMERHATVVTTDPEFRKFGSRIDVLWLPNPTAVN